MGGHTFGDPIPCPMCGDPFRPRLDDRRPTRGKFCSRTCARASRNGGWPARYWMKVNKTPTCWLWTGAADKHGYGSIKHGKGTRKAHHISYELAYGEIPPGMEVLHSCDNPSCVRPDHLKAGTHARNMAEMAERGRAASGDRSGPKLHPGTLARGIKNGVARLTEEQVHEIRRLHSIGRSQAQIAVVFGVSRATIGYIVLRKTWVHI